MTRFMSLTRPFTAASCLVGGRARLVPFHRHAYGKISFTGAASVDGSVSINVILTTLCYGDFLFGEPLLVTGSLTAEALKAEKIVFGQNCPPQVAVHCSTAACSEARPVCG